MGNSLTFGALILIAFIIRAAANGHLGSYLSVFTGGLSTNQATPVASTGTTSSTGSTTPFTSLPATNNINTSSPDVASNPIAGSFNLSGTQNTGLPF
jgi:hypothetical protein